MENLNTPSQEKSLDRQFFGHPGGLITLFFTEMWERMSYYGMRAMLVIFMTTAMQQGGLEFAVASATAIYGLYTGMVYFMGLPGGWLADRLLGGQKAVWYGGVIIMCGHVVLAIPSETTFFIGLILVVLGTGLLKPNITALVGQLYSDNDTRRDSGYALYYMGINIGAVLGYIIPPLLGEKVDWHLGFGAAAVGMAIGLVIYQMTAEKLGDVGKEPPQPLSNKAKQMTYMAIMLFVALVVVVTTLLMTGVLSFNAPAVAESAAYTFTAIFFIYYAVLYFGGDLTASEKKRMWALFLICVASACFWSGFEQAGSSLTLFAKEYTDRMVMGFEVPVGWFGSINSVFIIALSPFFAWLWIRIGQTLVGRSYGMKTALGLLIMATGFVVMFAAAMLAANGLKVAPYWLVATYFLHTVGELFLSPVALSAVSKLSPRRYSGQMMGLFVLTYSIGNVLAGILAGSFDPNNYETIPALFKQIAVFSIGVGIVLFLISFRTHIWEHAGESDKK